MSVVSTILVYLMIWMIVFFMSLPIGVNVSKESIPGNANSAPVKTNLKAKFFYSTIITLPLAYLVISLVENKFIISFINSLNI